MDTLKWTIRWLLVAIWSVSGVCQQTTVSPILAEGALGNVSFSTAWPRWISYERRVGSERNELYILDLSDDTSTLVGATEASDDRVEDADVLSQLLADLDNPASVGRFDGQLAWRPVLGPRGRQWFAFVSSAAGGGFDLFLSYVDRQGRLNDAPMALPFEGNEQYPSWSPDGSSLAFAGEGEQGFDLYVARGMDRLIAEETTAGFSPRPLTSNPYDDNYPAWSPDGRFIAYQAEVEENGILNYGINLIDMATAGDRTPASFRLTTHEGAYRFNELQPSWSPDGQFIAYYVAQTPLDEAPTDDEEERFYDLDALSITWESARRTSLAARAGVNVDGASEVVARNVLKRGHRGPRWLPTSGHGAQAIAYVANDPNRGFPIVLADFDAWRRMQLGYTSDLSSSMGTTNHSYFDVALFDGRPGLAFVSQEGGSLTLRTRGVPVFDTSGRRIPLLPGLLVPGLSPLAGGETGKGLLLLGAGVATGAWLGLSAARYGSALDDLDELEASYQRDLSVLRSGGEVDGRSISEYRSETNSDRIETASFAAWKSRFDEAATHHRHRQLAGVGLAAVLTLNAVDLVFLGRRSWSLGRGIHVQPRYRLEGRPLRHWITYRIRL